MQRNESCCASTTMAFGGSCKTTEQIRPAPITPLQRGKTMVISGTLVSFLGVAIYCAPIFSEILRNDPQKFMTEGLCVIGAGVAIWLIGSITYLTAAIESGEEESSL